MKTGEWRTHFLCLVSHSPRLSASCKWPQTGCRGLRRKVGRKHFFRSSSSSSAFFLIAKRTVNYLFCLIWMFFVSSLSLNISNKTETRPSDKEAIRWLLDLCNASAGRARPYLGHKQSPSKASETSKWPEDGQRMKWLMHLADCAQEHWGCSCWTLHQLLARSLLLSLSLLMVMIS